MTAGAGAPRLRPYQAAGAAFLAGRKAALLGDEMGLGKTAQAIAAAAPLAAGAPVLWIAPLATLPGLRREIEKWTPGASVTTLDHAGKIAMPTSGHVLLAYTSAAKRAADVLAGSRLAALILDECHRVKNPGAAVTGAVLGKWRKDADGRWTRTAALAAHADRVWAMSGTPVPNRPIELQPLLHLGFGLRWAGRSAYGDAYCRQTNRFSPRGFDYNGAQNLAGLNARLRTDGVLLRRTASDVPGELPELQIIMAPLNGAGSARIEKAALIAAEIDPRVISGAVHGDEITVPFTRLSAYRAALGLEKASRVAEWVIEWAESSPETALVVFAWHRDVCGAIAAHLGTAGIETLVATGDEPADVRQAKVDAFAAGTARVFVGTIAACGTGLNGLHLRTTHCAFAEFAWTPGELSQAIGRVRRIGGCADLTTATLVYLDGSLEGRILDLVARKLEIATTILADTAQAPAPVAPAIPAPAELAEIDDYAGLPSPTRQTWSWSKDRDGTWRIRCALEAIGPAGAAHPWEGAPVTVRKANGEKQEMALGRRLAGGPHNGGWSLWSFNPQPRDAARHEHLRRRARARQAEPVEVAPELLAWARSAIGRLADADPDHALVRNGVGFAAADVVLGHQLAAHPVEKWDAHILGLALRMLRKYRKQVGTCPEREQVHA